MTPKEIKTELEILKTNLENEIRAIGSKQASNLSGEAQVSISDWLGGRKKWSWEKIIDIATEIANETKD